MRESLFVNKNIIYSDNISKNAIKFLTFRLISVCVCVATIQNRPAFITELLFTCELWKKAICKLECCVRKCNATLQINMCKYKCKIKWSGLATSGEIQTSQWCDWGFKCSERILKFLHNTVIHTSFILKAH